MSQTLFDFLQIQNFIIYLDNFQDIFMLSYKIYNNYILLKVLCLIYYLDKKFNIE